MLLAAATALAVAWGTWAALGRIALHAVSPVARLEVSREARPVDAPVSGTVSASALALDRVVEAGELLVELDATEPSLALARERSALDSLAARAGPRRAELELLRRLASEQRGVEEERVAEGRARAAEAAEAGRLADAERERLGPLAQRGVIAEAEFERARSAAAQQRAAGQAASSAASRAAWEQRLRQTERRAEEQRLLAALAELEGEARAAERRVAELEHAIALRRITAPVAGRLGEIQPLQAGQFVGQGTRLASVIPEGKVRIVAEFDPAEAVGRVREGARARLRLHGFPWTQFGSVEARVARVGREIRSGTVRVELDVVGGLSADVPLQHGLPGTVEVDLEPVSPLDLLLRLAGRAAAGTP